MFNSHFNKDSFLSSIQPFIKIVPDFRPKLLQERIAPKCSVLYIPVHLLTEGNMFRDEATVEKYSSVLLPIHSYPDQRSHPVNLCEGDVTKPDRDHGDTVGVVCHKDSALADQFTLSGVDSQSCHKPRAPLHILWPHRW